MVSRGSRAGGDRRPGWPRCGHAPGGRAARPRARIGSGTAAWPVLASSPGGQPDPRRRRAVAAWPTARRPAPPSGCRAAAPRGRPPAPARAQLVPGPSAGRTAPGVTALRLPASERPPVPPDRAVGPPVHSGQRRGDGSAVAHDAHETRSGTARSAPGCDGCWSGTSRRTPGRRCSGTLRGYVACRRSSSGTI